MTQAPGTTPGQRTTFMRAARPPAEPPLPSDLSTGTHRAFPCCSRHSHCCAGCGVYTGNQRGRKFAARCCTSSGHTNGTVHEGTISRTEHGAVHSTVAPRAAPQRPRVLTAWWRRVAAWQRATVERHRRRTHRISLAAVNTNHCAALLETSESCGSEITPSSRPSEYAARGWLCYMSAQALSAGCGAARQRPMPGGTEPEDAPH